MAAAEAVAEREIARGQDVLVMTSRELVTGADEAASLDIGAVVARAAMRALDVPSVRICPWALREGVILEKLDQLSVLG